jgi:hypothetical protein
MEHTVEERVAQVGQRTGQIVLLSEFIQFIQFILVDM